MDAVTAATESPSLLIPTLSETSVSPPAAEPRPAEDAPAPKKPRAKKDPSMVAKARSVAAIQAAQAFPGEKPLQELAKRVEVHQAEFDALNTQPV